MFLSILKLIKYKLSMAVTLSATLGYFLYAKGTDPGMLFLIGGVFCLAGGSGSLNQVQEGRYDGLMPRTRNRPIPAGKIGTGPALAISTLLILTGSLLLLGTGLVPMLLGLINILLYNGLYTWLKRRTSFAVLPGGLVGAIPPLIGWSSAGGSLLHPTIIYVAVLMFLWQMPHFWILIIRYGKEYEAAGFTTIRRYLNEDQIKRLIFIWIAISSLFILAAPLFGIDLKTWQFILIGILNILLIGFFFRVLFLHPTEKHLRLIFMLTNIFLTLVLLGFILNSII